MDDVDLSVPATPPAAAAIKPVRSRWGVRVLMLSVPLAITAAAVWVWWHSGTSVSTDNAYVQVDKVSIAPEVGGRIIAIGVRENQAVQAGDLLFRIDPEPFALTVAEASAAIDSAQVQTGTLAAGLNATSVDIAAAHEDIAFAEANLRRQAALMEKGFTTRAALDVAEHGVAQAREKLRQAEADAVEARARMASGRAGGSTPQMEAARVRLAQARVNLGRTEVRAPAAGRVAQADRLQIGQMMVAGLPALTIVGTDRAWIEANFKETDLADMRAGQRAEIRFDAYPGLVVKGHVASIGAGTGSEFSVLPAQNANGNWVKVTQRVPVRIALDEKPPRAMIAGLSAQVTVKTKPAKAR
jgi:membrane fusion protein (multidrug efflux system)